LRSVVEHGLPSSAPHPGPRRASREDPPAHSSRVREPEKLAHRHPPRRRPRPPPGLPGRVHLPLQPAAHPDGSVPDLAWPRLGFSWPYDIRQVVLFGVNPIGTMLLMLCCTGSLGSNSPSDSPPQRSRIPAPAPGPQHGLAPLPPPLSETL